MSSEVQTAAVHPSLMGRARGFLVRVCIALLFVGGLVGLVRYESNVVRTGSMFDHPLIAALDSVDAAIHATHFGVSAIVREGVEPTMGELKALLNRMVGREILQEDVDLWSEVHPHYRVVYYRGLDEVGGVWIASARFIEGRSGAPGQVTLAYRRELLGRYEGIKSALQQMKTRLQYAAGTPLQNVMSDVQIYARPGPLKESDALIHGIMQGASARVTTRIKNGDDHVALGYTVRLGEVRLFEGQDVNVMVRVTKHGQQPWIELGTPVLF